MILIGESSDASEFASTDKEITDGVESSPATRWEYTAWLTHWYIHIGEVTNGGEPQTTALISESI